MAAMSESKRPLTVTIVACLYILIGTAGFIYHFKESIPLNRDGLLVESTELVALTAGTSMLRGQNWARWLAIAWMAFHVILSFFDMKRGLVVHSVFLLVIAWILLRPAAAHYFRRQRVETM